VSESADEQQQTEATEDQAENEELTGAVEEMLETIRQARVAPLILSTVSTFASVAYGKLEAKDLPEAKAAIDVIGALLPLLPSDVDEPIRRDFDQALTNLKLAYADAVTKAQ
jgi:hypothetical protein